MFGLCIAGRLPQTPSSQPDSTHLIFTLEKAQSINHVTVFMDGTSPFPDGYAATVHFQLPGSEWKMLGCLKNDKPSAIFRLRPAAGVGAATGATPNPDVTALLGISIEPEANVDAQMGTLSVGTATDSNPGALVKATSAQSQGSIDPQLALTLAPKIANNIFSYLSSFAPDSAPQTVPLLQKWLEQFERKLKVQGSEFLDRQG